MKLKSKLTTLSLVVGAAILGFSGVASAGGLHYKLVAKIKLPTKAGHGDWVSYDPGTNDVYVSLVQGMAVVNASSRKVVKDFPSIDAPNCMTFDDDYIYETEAQGPGAGKRNEVVVISKKDWKIVDHVATKGTSPDGIFIDKANGDLYVIMDDQADIEVYKTGAHPTYVKTIHIPQPAKPEAGPDVADLYNGTIYATNDSWYEQLNPNTGALGAAANYHLQLNKFGGTKGTFWDKDHNKIWIATANGAGMIVVDPKTLLVTKFVPQTMGADETAYDPGLGLAYAFEGGLPGFDVYNVKDETRVATVKTGTKKPTHSGTVDTRTHEVFAYVGGEASLWVYKPVK
ncbi:MAG: hypothetical protein KGI54_02865 [Pseudomonadota bacterium]|nr:hypothetical protein [Pseudomonadota bacterium]